jgi:hypothetical protein
VAQVTTAAAFGGWLDPLRAHNSKAGKGFMMDWIPWHLVGGGDRTDQGVEGIGTKAGHVDEAEVSHENHVVLVACSSGDIVGSTDSEDRAHALGPFLVVNTLFSNRSPGDIQFRVAGAIDNGKSLGPCDKSVRRPRCMSEGKHTFANSLNNMLGYVVSSR